MKTFDNRSFVDSHPIPGESLTNDPSRKLPYETAPEIVDLQEGAKFIWGKLSNKTMLPQLFRMLRQDVPVADIAQTITFSGFANGKWNYDLSIMLLEPTILQIIHLANQGGIKYVFSKDIPDINEAIRNERVTPQQKYLEGNADVKGLMDMEGSEMESTNESDMQVPSDGGFFNEEVTNGQ